MSNLQRNAVRAVSPPTVRTARVTVTRGAGCGGGGSGGGVGAVGGVAGGGVVWWCVWGNARSCPRATPEERPDIEHPPQCGAIVRPCVHRAEWDRMCMCVVEWHVGWHCATGDLRAQVVGRWGGCGEGVGSVQCASVQQRAVKKARECRVVGGAAWGLFRKMRCVQLELRRSTENWEYPSRRWAGWVALKRCARRAHASACSVNAAARQVTPAKCGGCRSTQWGWGSVCMEGSPQMSPANAAPPARLARRWW